MMREARGHFEPRPWAAAPIVHVGVGFGRDRVFATAAVVDTGADVCLFPPELVAGPIPPAPTEPVFVEVADGSRVPTTCHYPAITVGDIRIEGVATVFLDGEPLLGRSFLNRCEVRLIAQDGLVLLRQKETA